MPSFENIACPRCSRSLRLPVEVLDQSVRCPLCQATFIAGARQSTLDTLPETSSVKKFPPVGSLSLDDDIPPVPLAVEENDTALDEVEILEPPPPPPPLLRPIVPEGKPFAPVPFVLFVLNDPHDDLEGRYRAEVDAKGVHFWRGKNRVITAPPGSKAKYRYGTRLSLEVEGRMVEMTVVREEGLAEELAQQIVKFLQGKRDEVRLPKPRSYLLLPLVLLPLGIPLLAAIAGGFNGPPGGLMVWTFAALLVVGINCGLTFGLSGSLWYRGGLTAVVTLLGYLAMMISFALEEKPAPRMFPRPIPLRRWSDFPRPDHGFTVEMPSFPQRQQIQPNPDFVAGILHIAEMVGQPRGVRYQVRFGELAPQGRGPEFVDKTLAGLELQTMPDRNIPGRPAGREFRILGPLSGRGRIYVTAKRAVVLTAIGPNLLEDDPEVRRFLDSIRFQGADWQNANNENRDPVELAPGGRFLSKDTAYRWVGFQPDGSVLAVKSFGGYDIFSNIPGKEERKFPGIIKAAAIGSEQGELATIRSNLSQIFVSEKPADGITIPLFNRGGLASKAINCALSPDGSRLAVGYSDNKIRLYEWRMNNLIKTLDPPAGIDYSLTSLTFSPDGKRLAVGSLLGQLGQVIVHDLSDGTTQTLDAKHIGIPLLLFLSDSRRLATADPTGRLHISDVATGKSLQMMNLKTAVTSLAKLTTGRLFFVGYDNGEVEVFDVVSGASRGKLFREKAGERGVPTPRKLIYCLAVDREGQLLLVVSQRGIERWELSRLFEITDQDRQPPDPLPAMKLPKNR